MLSAPGSSLRLPGMYKADDDNTIVLYLQNAHATISSFTHEPVSFEF